MNKKFTVVLAGILCVLFISACGSMPKTPIDTRGGTSVPTVSSTPDAFIGQERAIEIALEKAGLTADEVVFDRTDLDKDNGVYIYEIEFRQGRTEYEADISATDGTILDWKVDTDD